MKAASLPLSLATILLVVGCAREPAKPFNTARAVDAIRTGEVHWNSDWKSGDAGKVASHYGQDATLMIPGQAPVVGLEAIRASVQKDMDDPGFSLTFNSDKVDVAASGDLAASRGTFTLTSTDPSSKAASTTTGTFVTVYKPQPDGGWKAVWDIATPGAAAAAAPAAK